MCANRDSNVSPLPPPPFARRECLRVGGVGGLLCIEGGGGGAGCVLCGGGGGCAEGGGGGGALGGFMGGFDSGFCGCKFDPAKGGRACGPRLLGIV